MADILERFVAPASSYCSPHLNGMLLLPFTVFTIADIDNVAVLTYMESRLLSLRGEKA